MVALVGALVPLVIALISSLRWPTLHRRVKDHAALAKDLNPDDASPLRRLLNQEIEELVRRDEALLDPTVLRARYVRRASRTALVAAVASAVTLAADDAVTLEDLHDLPIIPLALAASVFVYLLSELAFALLRRSYVRHPRAQVLATGSEVVEFVDRPTGI